MADLGLNEHHKAVIMRYMKFARYLRCQNEKQIEYSFKSMEPRLYDDTYTNDEVQNLLNDLKLMVTFDVESDFISFTHNNVLMLQQLFRQAEKWYLRLNIDISELENKEMLGVIQQLEEVSIHKRIDPKSESSSGSAEKDSHTLLKLEIERLKEENERLSVIVEQSEDQVDELKENREKLISKLLKIREEINSYEDRVPERIVDPSKANAVASLKEMEQTLKRIQVIVNEETEGYHGRTVTELLSTKEKMKQVLAQLQLTEAELEKRFTESKAYANMKKMLAKKNEQIRTLREKLAQTEPTEEAGENDEGDE